MVTEASEHLIARARRDGSAFGEIYDMYVSRVYAFCLSRTGDAAEAEDLTASTFERALSAFDRYTSSGAPMSSWLFRIAANLMIDRGRRGGRVVNLGDDAPPEATAHDVEDNPEQAVERWEQAAALRAHIASLPGDQQEAVRLRYWSGYATAEIAQQLGRSEGAVKQLLHRALVSLRAQV